MFYATDGPKFRFCQLTSLGENMQKKHHKFALISIFALLFFSILNGCDQERGINPWEYPKNPPAGIYNPEGPWTELVYRLPHPWQINTEQAEFASLSENGQQKASLFIKWQNFPTLTPAESVDQDYDHFFCQKSGQQDPFINCEKGFQKGSLAMDDYEVNRLTYFGTAMGSDVEVNQIYLVYHDGLLNLQTEGPWEFVYPAIKSVLKTLSFKQHSESRFDQSSITRETQGL